MPRNNRNEKEEEKKRRKKKKRRGKKEKKKKREKKPHAPPAVRECAPTTAGCGCGGRSAPPLRDECDWHWDHHRRNGCCAAICYCARAGPLCRCTEAGFVVIVIVIDIVKHYGASKGNARLLLCGHRVRGMVRERERQRKRRERERKRERKRKRERERERDRRQRSRRGNTDDRLRQWRDDPRPRIDNKGSRLPTLIARKGKGNGRGRGSRTGNTHTGRSTFEVSGSGQADGRERRKVMCCWKSSGIREGAAQRWDGKMRGGETRRR